MTKVLQLTNARVRRMVKHSNYSEFEVLRDPPMTTKPQRSYGCGKCGKKKAKKHTTKPQVDLNKVKQGLSSLSSGQKTKLKQKLGCKKVKISFKTPRGILKRVSF